MEEKIKKYFNRRTIGNVATLSIGILLYLSIANFSVVTTALNRFFSIISPFIYAFALAFILNNPVNWFEQKIFKKGRFKKALSITVVYIIFLTTLSALFFAITPQIIDSVVTITDSVPAFLQSLSVFAAKTIETFNIDASFAAEIESAIVSIVQSVSAFALALIPQILNFSLSVGNLVVKILVALIASVYMLLGKERLIFQFKKLTYAFMPLNKANRTLTIARRSNKIFSGFIVGKIIDSTIIGIICFVCMWFIYRPLAVLISIVIGVTNMIPFFGPFIGAIPCAFILLVMQPSRAIIFIIFIIILQQVDGNIIGPKILGDSTGLSAMWVLIAIVVGNGLFGFIGMLIGVPTFAVLYSILSENITNRLDKKGLEQELIKNTFSSIEQTGKIDETK